VLLDGTRDRYQPGFRLGIGDTLGRDADHVHETGSVRQVIILCLRLAKWRASRERDIEKSRVGWLNAS
jgi:hypothetical protein